jgi:AbrB family looped-hinge helix DNA binding protein
MIEGVSTVTRKGQVTVPIEIRRALGIKRGDKVAFTLEDGQAKLRPQLSYTERTKGIVKTDQPPLSAEKFRDLAEQAFVDEFIERSGG